MKPRRLQVTPQARRDFEIIIAWYRRKLGASAAAKAARSIQAGLRASTRIALEQASRSDLPTGYYRVVAKTHLVIFTVSEQASKIVRILHGARDIAALLEVDKE